jgi:TolB protein
MSCTTRSLSVVLMLGVTILLAAVAAPVARATFPGINGRITFDHAGKIYTVNPDGSALVRVTAGPSDGTPEWSPDGHSIAFSRTGDAMSPLGRTIWIANADGTGQRRVTPQDPKSSSYFPRFTPDGQTIVYQNCLGFDCDGGIFAIRADGTQLRHITSNSGESYNWAVPSPDGRTIAFMRWHVGGVRMRIYLIRTDGTRQRAVTPIALEGWAPDWAPNGQTILFTSNNFGNRPNAALYSIRPDGSGLRRLNRPRFPYSDYDASYSPDGANIVLSSNRRYPSLNHSDLFILRADGTGLRRVPLPFNDVANPRWGPTPTP